MTENEEEVINLLLAQVSHSHKHTKTHVGLDDLKVTKNCF